MPVPPQQAGFSLCLANPPPQLQALGPRYDSGRAVCGYLRVY